MEQVGHKVGDDVEKGENVLVFEGVEDLVLALLQLEVLVVHCLVLVGCQIQRPVKASHYLVYIEG